MNSDFEDAYEVILVIADCEDYEDSYGRKIKKNWEKCLKNKQELTEDFTFLKKVKHKTHGRKVSKEYLNNPVIIGKTQEGSLIALDGNHRISEHLKLESPQVNIILLDISWLEDADAMDFN